MPLISGAVGYFSYDYGRKFEKIESRHGKKLNMPEALFVFYDFFIIEDKLEKALYLTACLLYTSCLAYRQSDFLGVYSTVEFF